MKTAVDFSTISEMFSKITEKYLHDKKPVLMHKVRGRYQGITYAELRDLVNDFACGLSVLNVRQSDNIGLISENRPEWIVSDLAMVQLGAVNVPLYPTLTSKQIEFILNDAEVKLAIVSNQFQLNKVLKILDEVKLLKKIIVMTKIEGIDDSRIMTFSEVIRIGAEFRKTHEHFLDNRINKIKPNDLLTIIYTSGTTGNPKGVMLSHKNLVSNITACASVIPISHEDIVLSYLPLCHTFERMAGYYTVMSCGTTIAFSESIETLRENMLEVHPTMMTTVPRLFERFYGRVMKQVDSIPAWRRKIFFWAMKIGKKRIADKIKGNMQSNYKHKIADLLVYRKIRMRTGGKIKYFVSGGAALARELGEFFDIVGLSIIEGYGLTESSPVISVNRLYDYKFGTVGKPIPGVEVKIADDGEILARGSNIMLGYWKNPEATKEVIDKDGWLHTGDIGTFDSEGHLKITDRLKHLFVSSGGKNIAPQPIENLFLQNKFIDQFVLIGDKRNFLSALIVPDFEVLKDYALKHKIEFNNIEELINNEDIIKLIDKEINVIQRDLSSYERVRRFTILRNPLTVESGEITPSLKIRRKIVEDKFKDVIDKMYEGLN